MCFLAVPAIKNTGRSGCLPACDLATGKCMCFRQPLLPVFLTASTARKHLNSKGKFFGTPCTGTHNIGDPKARLSKNVPLRKKTVKKGDTVSLRGGSGVNFWAISAASKFGLKNHLECARWQGDIGGVKLGNQLALILSGVLILSLVLIASLL